MSLAALASRARGLCDGRSRAILGITGPPGGGKTTLVELLLQKLREDPPAGTPAGDWVAHVPMDGFHLGDVQLVRLGLRDRKGAPDTFDPGGYLSALRRLRTETEAPVYVPGFDRTLEQPIAAAIAVLPEARLVLTEGNYLLLPSGDWPLVRREMDEVWYVDLDPAERLTRLIARHVEFGKTPEAAAEWVHRSDEVNAALVATTVTGADLVVQPAGLDLP